MTTTKGGRKPPRNPSKAPTVSTSEPDDILAIQRELEEISRPRRHRVRDQQLAAIRAAREGRSD